MGTFAKVKELIAFRKANEVFRLSERSEINEKLKDLKVEGSNISYTLGDFKVIHSVGGGHFDLDGEYEIVYSNTRSSYGRVSGSFSPMANESVVLRKVQ